MPNTTTVTNISQFSVAVLSTLFSIIMWTIQHLILCEVASVLPRIALRQSPLTMQDYHCGQQHGSLSLSPPPLSLPTNSKAICVQTCYTMLTVLLVSIGTGKRAYCLYLNMSSFSAGTFYVPHFYFIPCISDLSPKFYSLPEASPS